MAYASGKNAWGISDRSGRRYRLRDMKKEWTGALVGPDEYEPKHPQLYPPKAYPDPQALRNPRPDRVEPAVEVLLQNNPFTTGAQGSSVVTVYELAHGRSTDDVVRFRTVAPFDGITAADITNASGYAVTKVDENNYTITVSGTATVGGIRGGGDFASAGPVTVEA
jgi:hypothetical protein